MIFSDAVEEADGRRERTDQVGFERRAAMSRSSLCEVWGELYARVLGRGHRFWATSACRREARQRRHIDRDMLPL